MPSPGSAQNVDAVRARYTKHEFLIPMRDGVRLFTVVYTPKDTSQPYPFLLTRTPYSVAPYGVDNYRASLGPSEQFEREGFIFVYQDARGRRSAPSTNIRATRIGLCRTSATSRADSHPIT